MVYCTAAEKGALLLLVISCVSLCHSEQRYDCPYDALQLITSGEVTQSAVLHAGSSNIDDIISVGCCNYWTGYTFPNNGTWTFEKNFVIVGLTTTGRVLSGSQYYVRNFTLSYSDSLDGSFQAVPSPFIVPSSNETLFRVEPILTRRLKFFVHNVALNTFYYWRLNLFGCPQENATLILEPSLTSPSPSIDASSLADLQTSTAAGYSSIATTIVSTVILVTKTQTVIVSSSPFGTIENQVALDNCQGAITAAIVVPLLMLFILITAVVSIILAKVGYNRYKQTNGQHTRRKSTLKEVPNTSLYTMTDNNNTTHQEDWEMYNAMYNSTSLPNSPAVVQDVYSEVNENENTYENPMGGATYEETPVGGATYEETPVGGAIYEETPVGGADQMIRERKETYETVTPVQVTDNVAYTASK